MMVKMVKILWCYNRDAWANIVDLDQAAAYEKYANDMVNSVRADCSDLSVPNITLFTVNYFPNYSFD